MAELKTDLKKEAISAWADSGTQAEKKAKVSPASAQQLTRSQNFRAQKQVFKFLSFQQILPESHIPKEVRIRTQWALEQVCPKDGWLDLVLWLAVATELM